jgi:hypothetical protein
VAKYIKPARMLALQNYITALTFGLYVLVTDATKDRINYVIQKNETLSAPVSEDHVELLSYKLKVEYLITILVFIIFDFHFRFRVIESLYQRYKNQETNQNRTNVSKNIPYEVIEIEKTNEKT